MPPYRKIPHSKYWDDLRSMKISPLHLGLLSSLRDWTYGRMSPPYPYLQSVQTFLAFHSLYDKGGFMLRFGMPPCANFPIRTRIYSVRYVQGTTKKRKGQQPYHSTSRQPVDVRL